MAKPKKGGVLIYGRVLETGMRMAGDKPIIFADVITSSGVFRLQEWEKTSYDGPDEDEIAFFEVSSFGREYRGVQQVNGQFLTEAPNLIALAGTDIRGRRMAAATNGAG